ncbi:MAG: hypothetical protein RBR22_09195 [Desulfuromonas sp.]|nr:hypothetical protein [Desulfuromonas sp.]
METFAAIDVGSNAVRLMIARVEVKSGRPSVQKEVFLRIPLRLGTEVFSQQRLSATAQTNLVKTMLAFRQIIEVFAPQSYRACATSAMRDAENGLETVAMVEREAGIKLEVIDGLQEAMVVFSSHVQDSLDPEQCYLFIDVGGGSTELLLYRNGEILCSNSFNIGTVRILHNTLNPAEWDKMQQWLHQQVKPYMPIAIGSGGNINRINRIVKKDSKKIMSRSTLKRIYTHLSELSIEERVILYGLKSGRADVIVPAGRIYLSAMQWAGIGSIHVPKFGLVDGLIIQQYELWQSGKQTQKQP